MSELIKGRPWTAALLLVIFTFGGVAVAAGIAQEGYRTLRSAPVAYTAVAGVTTQWAAADSGDISDNVNELRPTRGNPNVGVTVLHYVNSATAAIQCHLWQVGDTGTETWLGIAGIWTSTAVSGPVNITNGTYFFGKQLTFDTGSATHFELRVEAISSGTIELPLVYTFGAAPQ